MQTDNPRLEELERQIAEQEALVRRMVARGAPNQEAYFGILKRSIRSTHI